MRANGEQNNGLVATTASPSAIAVKATNSAVGTTAGLGPAVLGLASKGTAADIQSPGFMRAAGEFSGPTGVIGAASTDTAGGVGVIGVSSGTSGSGVWGDAASGTGTNFGVMGTAASAGGIGVNGAVTSSTGVTYGVLGQTYSPDGYGLSASNSAASSGAGAAIQANGNSNNGLVATTASTSAVAVKATNSGVGTTAGQGPAVQGLASKGAAGDTHPSGTAFYRAAGEFSGPIGVIGAASTDADDGYGVIGVGDGTSGTGVYGRAPLCGVFGAATATSGTYIYGVLGYAASPSGYALYGQGNGGVTGSFSKGGGAFKIDHPLDPANKFLYHSFVESPDMKNVYDGVVTLDAAGEATVSLPDWFEALNRDTRIQLTAVGEFSPLYVKSEMQGNSFSIAGGKASQRVYWQLTGIRKDSWANAHRIPVEEEKPADEKGLYLHPVENGQPAAKGIDAVRNEAMKPHPSK
jgi:hypothetical protein